MRINDYGHYYQMMIKKMNGFVDPYSQVKVEKDYRVQNFSRHYTLVVIKKKRDKFDYEIRTVKYCHVSGYFSEDFASQQKYISAVLFFLMNISTAKKMKELKGKPAYINKSKTQSNQSK